MNFASSINLAIFAKNFATKTKSHHLCCSTTFISSFRENWKTFTSKFNVKHRNVCIHDSLIRNLVLISQNFTYLYMWHDKQIRSRHDFVANFVEQIRSFANNDFVSAKQDLLRFLAFFFVAKVWYFFFRKSSNFFQDSNFFRFNMFSRIISFFLRIIISFFLQKISFFLRIIISFFLQNNFFFCEPCCFFREVCNFSSENFTLIAKVCWICCNRCNSFFNHRNFVCNCFNWFCDYENRNINREHFMSDRNVNRTRFRVWNETFNSIASFSTNNVLTTFVVILNNETREKRINI
jgi:hypothetical protein